MERHQADKQEVCPYLRDMNKKCVHISEISLQLLWDGSCLPLALCSWHHHQYTWPSVQASTEVETLPKRTEIPNKWFHLRCDSFHSTGKEDEEQGLKTRQDELFDPLIHSKMGTLPFEDSVLGARSPVPSTSGYLNDSEIHFQGAVELTMWFS